LGSQSATAALPPATAGRSVVGVCSGHELCEWLFPHLGGLVVERIEPAGDGVVIEARSRAAGAACPACGTWSSRVHSGYVRTVADGPAGGRPVWIRLGVRRFLCRNPACPAITFAEQVDGLTGRYVRRSLPLLGVLAQIGLALAGRAGARLAAALGAAVHRTTLLRLVAALPEPPIGAAPQVLGVDDFALRKGQVYGTVLVDVATGEAVDVLASRDAATLAAWLAAHPGARVICRDRAGNYAQGARDGAPDAIQVADRWHLWHNLAEHAEKTVVAHRGCLKPPDPQPGDASGTPPEPGPAGATAAAAATPPAGPDGLRDACGRPRRLVARTRQRHAAIHQLLAEGRSLGAISRTLGLDRGTVQRFARAPDAEQLLVKATNRDSKLDPCKPYLNQRRNQGVTTAAVLHAELQAQGWTGSVQTVQRYLRQFRPPPAAPPPPPAAPPPPATPKPRQITRWLLSRTEHLQPHEQAKLAEIRARCPHIDALATHITRFAEMMTHRTGQHNLENWLAAVDADDQPYLHSFATGIRQDQHAVTNGLTLPYSSAAVEGNVTRIKMIKRQMYGRAGFNLLRKRVILHPR
jgi:transposase